MVSNVSEDITNRNDTDVAVMVDGKIDDCPCMQGKPFMHVMTNLTEGNEQPVSWKKR